MGLVEREPQLAALRAAAAEVRRTGTGRVVLVAGEAGAGKTVLMRSLLEPAPDGMAARLGGSDSLRTARPFGPVRDWAEGGDAGNVLRTGSDPHLVHDATLDLLAAAPTVAVVDDVHWADDATLDLLTFLGRRITRTKALLVMTFRPDEAPPGSPLALLLGDLATTSPVRIAVSPLSRDGVARLAEGRDVDLDELHRRTGGNAFFVTECLATDEPMPATVRDAVLARVHRLDSAARAVVTAVSACPGRCELWLATALGLVDDALDRAVASGVLVADVDAVRFRHELAREAVLSAVLPARRQRLHRQVLNAVEAHVPLDTARAAHHAVAAGDVDAILRHAPPAASDAAAAGARREAVAHLEHALQYSDRMTRDDRRDLLIRLGEQRELLGRPDDAVRAFRAAIAETADEPTRGALLLRLVSPLVYAGRDPDATEALDAAVDILERSPEGPALALAYGHRSSQFMLARQFDAAERWGQRAMSLAAEYGDELTLAQVRIQSGVARWMDGHEEGLARIESGIAIGHARGWPTVVARGLMQIGSGGGENRMYAAAVPALEECVSYAEVHELTVTGLYAAAWLGRCRLELGRWDEAAATLTGVLRSPRAEGISLLTATTALGRLRARRGDPDPWSLLDRALELARPSGHLQRLWPVTAARAEAAFLEGRLHHVVEEVVEVHALALELDQPWATEELGFWLWRAGGPASGEGGVTPYADQISGRPQVAAQRWAQIGCRFEAAIALADCDDDDQQLAALRILTELGAGPSMRRLANERRHAGRSVPRGPNAASRANIGGLTDRELDVLRLIAAGRTTRQIAAELHLSTKTVGHHVSHLLTKLNAHTRAEAATIAVTAGLETER